MYYATVIHYKQLMMYLCILQTANSEKISLTVVKLMLKYETNKSTPLHDINDADDDAKKSGKKLTI